MNKIFGYIKRDEDPNVLLFTSDVKRAEVVALFADRFDGLELIDYDNEHVLEDDECWTVELSDTQFEVLKQQYVTDLESTTNHNPSTIRSADGNMRALYLVEETQVVFKCISKRQYMRDSSILSLDGEPRVTDLHNILAVDAQVDAVLEIDTQKLRFRNFNSAKQLFPFVIEFYRSATQAEVDQWLGAPLFEVDENFATAKVGAANRKKIAFALKELAIVLDEAQTAQRIKTHAANHAIAGLFDGDKFNLATNKDVTEMMRIVTGAYHTNPITDDPMLARSAYKVRVESSGNE